MTEQKLAPTIPRNGPATNRGRHIGIGLALLGATGFATSGPLSQSVLAAGFTPMQLSQMRQTVSAALLLLIVLLWAPQKLRIRLRQLPMLMLYGVTSYLLLQTFYFEAISRIPIGIALLIQFTAPVWVALWVRLVRGTRLPGLTWAGAALVLIGSAFVGQVWDSRGSGLDPVGLAAAAATALCLTCFYLFAERGLNEFDPIGLVTWGAVSAAVMFAIIRPVWTFPFERLTEAGGIPRFPQVVWLLVLVIGVLSTAMPAVSEVAALRYLASPTASVLGTAEVLIGAVLAWLLVNEVLAPPQIVGGLIVLSGIALAQIRPLSRAEAGPSGTAAAPPPHDKHLSDELERSDT
ncbi:permease [Micromonospora qiuiae]|uniref:Permease n=1 Tax=Micromonospora qiuiae TaxID=502268 RepID=A0ABQ4JEY7_9ACTN|nr:DMT family transporter [Micromonospora qiuiae]GIJ28765.1 permease [Micromonospora qiuiae]